MAWEAEADLWRQGRANPIRAHYTIDNHLSQSLREATIRQFHLSFSGIWPILSSNHLIARILSSLASFSAFFIHLSDNKKLVALASLGFVFPFGAKTSPK